jgi:acetaldehyde dehydrogenase
MNNPNKLKVAIIGTGNIGADLMVKVHKSDRLECAVFAGRNLESRGMQLAKNLGIHTTNRGYQAVIDNPEICDIIIDCTSAQSHIEHWPLLKKLGKPVIDMTPAKIGDLCIPVLNADQCIANHQINNMNMVTCGGQTSVPIAYAISQVHDDIEYLEVSSNIASLSAGPATRDNLDEYIETTEYALSKFTGIKKTKAILILNPAVPQIDMQTTIYAKIKTPRITEIRDSVESMVKQLNEYVPGYSLIVPPTVVGNHILTTVKVLGAGDYLPSYAGNLDIINCAAIRLIECMSTAKEKQ